MEEGNKSLELDAKRCCMEMRSGKIPMDLTLNPTRYSMRLLMSCSFLLKQQSDSMEEFEQLNVIKCFNKVLEIQCEGINSLNVRKPHAHFEFPGISPKDMLKLPLLPWATFRGYSISFWINVQSSTASRVEYSANLYKFSSPANLGVEAILTSFRDEKCTITIRSSGGRPEYTVASAISVLRGHGKRWRSISRHVPFSLDQWHSIVIVHMPHYVKKSTVSCFIDGKQHFCEELPYPTVTDTTMSHCSIGGGNGAVVKVSNISMYEDELPQDCIKLLHVLGPDHPSLLHSLPLTIRKGIASPYLFMPSNVSNAIMHQLPRIRLIFSYCASNCNGDVCQEWPHDGQLRGDGLLLEMQNISGTLSGHSAYHLHHARLEGHAVAVSSCDIRSMWYRIGGVKAVFYIVSRVISSTGAQFDEQKSDLLSWMLRLVESLMYRSHSISLDALQGNVFHLLSHMLRQHGRGYLSMKVVDAAVQLALSTSSDCFWGESQHNSWISDPFQNPTLALALRCFLLDFETWASCSIEIQLALIHKILDFAVANPQRYNGIVGVQATIDIIRLHYCLPGRLSKFDGQDTESLGLDDSKIRRAVQLLCEIVFVCVSDAVMNLDSTEQEPKCGIYSTQSEAKSEYSIGLTAWCAVSGLLRLLLDCQDKMVGPLVIGTLERLFHLSDGEIGTILLCHDVLDALCVVFQRRSELIRAATLEVFLKLLSWVESEKGKMVVARIQEWKTGQKSELHFVGPQLSCTLAFPAIKSIIFAQDVSQRHSGWTPSLSFRLSVIRRIALKQLKAMQKLSRSTLLRLKSLPLSNTLPFLALLLPLAEPDVRESSLMEISVILKTEKHHSEEILRCPQWVDWLISLLAKLSNEETRDFRTQLSNSTGVELVFDSMVTLLGAAMQKENGWHIWIRLSGTLVDHKNVLGAPILILRSFAARTLQKISRENPLLTRPLAENIGKILTFVDESLLASESPQLQSIDDIKPLVSAMVDISSILLGSTSRKYRLGLLPALHCIQRILPISDISMSKKLVQLLKAAIEQEVTAGSVLHIYGNTRDMILTVFRSIEKAIEENDDASCRELFRTLVLDCVNGGSLDYEIKGVNLESLNQLSNEKACDAIFHVLADQMTDICKREEHDAVGLDIISLFPSVDQLTMLDVDSFNHAPPTLRRHGSGYDEDRSSYNDIGYVAKGKKGSLVEAEVELLEAKLFSVVGIIRNDEKDRVRKLVEGYSRTSSFTNAAWDDLHATIDSQCAPSLHAKTQLFVGTNQRLYLDVHEGRHPGRIRRRLKPGFCNALTPLNENLKDSHKSNNDSLMKQVGRAIAKGGSIADITVDIPDAIEEKLLDTIDDKREEEEFWAQSMKYRESIDGNDMHATPQIESNRVLPWQNRLFVGPRLDVEADNHVETDFLVESKCRMVIPNGIVPGNFIIRHSCIQFVPNDNVGEVEGREGSHSLADEAPGLYRTQMWSVSEIVAVYLRRFRLRDSAVEFFMFDGDNFFFDFPKERRNEMARHIMGQMPRNTVKQWPGMSNSRLIAQCGITKLWQDGSLSNFEYLMALNTLAGRSYNDLTQYPVFPWVLADYQSEVLDLADPKCFRDLSKPIGALNPERLEEFRERFASFEDPHIPKFLYGSHYSTCAGVVLYFLLRLEPFTQLHINTQGGKIDVADRLFFSINETWKMCNSSMSEVKELIPEFFVLPEFLRNVNGLDLGQRQDGDRVSHVELPPWASTPEEFVEMNRAALESDYVSRNLHHWIDLIFGYKQRGQDALKSDNVFYYLTYYGLVDVDAIEDEALRTATELQIAHFGQCPMQLLTTPHPSRGERGRSMIPRSLSNMFVEAVQEDQSKPVRMHPLGPTAVSTCSVIGNIVLCVNDLGVIEIYRWILVPEASESARYRRRSLSNDEGNSDVESVEFDGAIDVDMSKSCLWKLSVERDQTPFEVVPRVPVSVTKSDRNRPVIHISPSGIIASVGDIAGAVYFSQIDLENGQLVSSVSMQCHDETVTCLDSDSLSYDRGELWVSGSTDATLAVWKLSSVRSTLRTPRITRYPLMILLGHCDQLNDCSINNELGIVVSCSSKLGIVHSLQSQLALFSFKVLEGAELKKVCVSRRGFILSYGEYSNSSAYFEVYSVAGVRLLARRESSSIKSWCLDARGEILVTGTSENELLLHHLPDWGCIQRYPCDLDASFSCLTVGPAEAESLIVTGFQSGDVVIHLLPDTDGTVSLLGSVGKFLGIQSKIRIVKGTVQQAQNIANNAKAATNTASAIAGEAIGEAKSLVKGIFDLVATPKK